MGEQDSEVSLKKEIFLRTRLFDAIHSSSNASGRIRTLSVTQRDSLLASPLPIRPFVFMNPLYALPLNPPPHPPAIPHSLKYWERTLIEASRKWQDDQLDCSQIRRNKWSQSKLIDFACWFLFLSDKYLDSFYSNIEEPALLPRMSSGVRSLYLFYFEKLFAGFTTNSNWKCHGWRIGPGK